MKFYFFILLIASQFTIAQKSLKMDFVSWLRNDPKLIFLSDKGDTAYFEVDAHHLKDKDYSRKTIEYIWKCKGAARSADLIEIDTFAIYPPHFTLLLEGCITNLNEKNFNTEYIFQSKTLNDVGVFEVMHHNYAWFKEETGVDKVWWSATEGLLKYTTRDKITWTRLK